MKVNFGTNKPIGLNLNGEQAEMLLRGLERLEESDKKSVLYAKIKQDLNMIKTIWDRRIKNEKIVQETKRQIAKKSKQKQSETLLQAQQTQAEKHQQPK